MKPKILVIHTEKTIMKLIEAYLENDFEVIGTPDRKTGITLLEKNPDTQLVITNAGKTQKGLLAYTEMKAIKKGIKVLFVSADEGNKIKFNEIMEQEKKTNSDIIFQLDFLSPFNLKELKKKIDFLVFQK